MPLSTLSLNVLILAVSFLGYGLLARVSPCNPGQPAFATRELAKNATYFLVGFLLYGALFYDGLQMSMIKLAAGIIVPGRGDATARMLTSGWGWLERPPLLVQALLILFITDFIQYWAHRLFHTGALWPFHVVHHSAEEVDWTTGYRFHPVNFALYSAGAYALVSCLGFSPAAFLIIVPFNLVMSGLVHANLNWSFGPFRYVIASPVFHRWHHVREEAARDKNFAPTFPVLDLMFGTFYMPKGVLPADYGVEGAPMTFLGQLIYPFAVYAERLGLTRKPGPGQAPA